MKKILALALVLVLALGMMVPAAAASKPKVTGVNLADETSNYDRKAGESIKLHYTYNATYFDQNTDADDALKVAIAADLKSGKDTAVKSYYNKLIKTIEPRFAVRKGGQVFSDISIDNITGPSATLSDAAKSRIVKATIAAGIKAAAAGDKAAVTTDLTFAWKDFNVSGSIDPRDQLEILIDSLLATTNITDQTATAAVILDAALTEYDVQLKAETAKISTDWTFDVVLDTVNPFVNVNSIDYEVDVYFLLDGKRTDSNYKHNVYGEFKNETTEVDKDTYDADSYEGQVIKATEYVPKIAIVGNYEYDVTANIKMAKDKKIYFYVTTESDSSDEAIFNKYPAIDMTFKVNQVGLNSYTGNFIKLGGVDSTYYVYGKDAEGALKYLGRGGELLPLSAKYYVSTTKLDIVDTTVDEELPTETEPVPENPNYNPETGI